ncbi:MAG: hypothetical protein ABW061_18760 [Polyangiaceae bacterium]
MKHVAWVLLGSLGAVGCASSAVNLEPSKVPSDQGALFGHIEVENQGKDITGSCYVALSDEGQRQKANLSLDRTGWLFTAVPRGSTYLSTVMCVVGGLVKYQAAFNTRKLKFDVPGAGTIAYFGHLSIDLRSEGSGVAAATIFFGGLGNALAASGEGEDGRMKLRDGFAEAKREYQHRYGRQALLTPTLALAAVPALASAPVLASTPASIARPKLRAAPPIEAVGFELGKGIAAAETRCTAAGFVWKTLEDARASCSGSVRDLRVPVTVTLTARDGLLAEVAADASADGAPWSVLVARFDQLSSGLVARHGAHFGRKTEALQDCTESTKACFTAGRTRTRMTWHWADEQVTSLTLTGAQGAQPPSLWLRYGRGDPHP